jgi:murein DD-endopeptidase MepM/ murein hydrolase activator NlpD
MRSWYGSASISVWKGEPKSLKDNKNSSRRSLLILPVLLVIGVLVVLLVVRMEGKPPIVSLTMDSPALGANQSLPLEVVDTKSGLRKVMVSLLKDGQEITLLEKMYPSAGLFRGGAISEESVSVPFEPAAKGIKDGKALLRVTVRDFSWRQWGKGNVTYQEHEVVIDTRPPMIDVLSRANYFSQGGAGLVIYKVSEECRTSGVSIGEHFYPGVSGHLSDPRIFMAMVAVDYRQGPSTPVHVTATDLAGNQTRVGLPNLINARRFKKDELPISESFLDWKMPEFINQVDLFPGASNLDIFLKVNTDLRRANEEMIAGLTAHSDPTKYWEGEFLRLPAAAPKAGFADHRSYFYKGKKIDEQTHMGIDLASLERSVVPAANTGKVVFSDYLGIYGSMVLIDHGMGLFSMYSHLSQMSVAAGQMVNKGETIGRTGVTGLAGGDHLHYGMLVHRTWVNPIEWWDAQWIRNNIYSKIDAVKKP